MGVRERLISELERMRVASPSAVLRLSSDAGPTTARSAFLAMVKEFHPHRFAREPSEIQHMANEVFLLVKAAYDALATAPKRPRRRKRGTTSPPVQPSRPSRAVRFKKVSRRSRPTTAPPPIGDRPPAPAASAAPSRQRRPSNHSQLVAALETEEQERAEKFREGVKLIKTGRPAEARELFRNLAINKPGEKKFRVYMHYAWGREHQGAGRFEDAAAEFRRALKLDPHFDDAIGALDEVSDAAEKQTGVFGRLFRRGR